MFSGLTELIAVMLVICSCIYIAIVIGCILILSKAIMVLLDGVLPVDKE